MLVMYTGSVFFTVGTESLNIVGRANKKIDFFEIIKFHITSFPVINYRVIQLAIKVKLQY